MLGMGGRPPILGVGGSTYAWSGRPCLCMASTAAPFLGADGHTFWGCRGPHLCLALPIFGVDGHTSPWRGWPLHVLGIGGSTSPWSWRPRLCLELTAAPMLGVVDHDNHWQRRPRQRYHALVRAMAEQTQKHNNQMICGQMVARDNAATAQGHGSLPQALATGPRRPTAMRGQPLASHRRPFGGSASATNASQDPVLRAPPLPFRRSAATMAMPPRPSECGACAASRASPLASHGYPLEGL